MSEKVKKWLKRGGITIASLGIAYVVLVTASGLPEGFFGPCDGRLTLVADSFSNKFLKETIFTRPAKCGTESDPTTMFTCEKCTGELTDEGLGRCYGSAYQCPGL